MLDGWAFKLDGRGGKVGLRLLHVFRLLDRLIAKENVWFDFDDLKRRLARPGRRAAARLCGEAKGGQILVSSRVAAAVEELIDTEEGERLALRGFLKPVPTFNVRGLKGT